MADRQPSRAAVFLDRDGVINEERGHVHRPQDFVLLPGVLAGLQELRHAGLPLVVVTNQAGIARGLYGVDDYLALTEHMRLQLRAAGITLAGVYCCPHHPTEGIGRWKCDCACRKPQPGLLQAAAVDLGLDLAASFLVGDKASDIAAGRAAGLRGCVLVESGHPVSDADRRSADRCEPGLLQAAHWIAARSAPLPGRPASRPASRSSASRSSATLQSLH